MKLYNGYSTVLTWAPVLTRLHKHAPCMSITAQHLQPPAGHTVAPHDPNVGPKTLKQHCSFLGHLITKHVLPRELNGLKASCDCCVAT